MKGIMSVLVAALGLLLFSPLSAKADQCVSLGGKPFVTRGFSAGFHDSRGRFFFGLGPDNRRRYESYYCPGVVVPFQAAPQYQDNPQADTGRSGSGDLYINGYRVMPSGWLRVRVKPADVELLIDGYPVVIDQKTGMSAIIGFPVGAHSVAARKEGLKPFYSEVEIKQAQLIDVDILLNRQ